MLLLLNQAVVEVERSVALSAWVGVFIVPQIAERSGARGSNDVVVGATGNTVDRRYTWQMSG